MRLTVRNFMLVCYIMICTSLSILNYRYSAINNNQNVANDHHHHNWKAALQILNQSKAVNTIVDNNQEMVAVVVGGKEKESLKLWPDKWNKTDRILEQINYKPPRQPMADRRDVVIYLPHGLHGWSVRAGRSMFVEQNCIQKNCILTDKNSQAEHADAILFRNQVFEVVSNRSSKQIWIFYTLESPENTPRFDQFASQINWTATFKWNSDIVTPYEKLAPLYFDDNKQRRLHHLTMRNYARGKTKQVAWFVSNCYTTNNRKRYADELSRHISVDIFGNCGPHRCPRLDRKCEQKLDNDFKFYLAFENSNCREYITEKFYVTGLKHDVIPVVMGARREDYARVAPRHSFIHVDDFESPEALGKYLLYLDSNDTAYNEYFLWKQGQRKPELIDTKFWCRLCTMLNLPSKPKSYSNMDAWWHSDGVCVSGSWNKIGKLSNKKH